MHPKFRNPPSVLGLAGGIQHDQTPEPCRAGSNFQTDPKLDRPYPKLDRLPLN
jgi:hypothetical protein